ncbi:nitroreductase/quinone reductase family protein [Actinoplanes sp. NPDC049599]|uniref:nitroreductase/quinone reductase family protein n=1 Tax=Actinoplanes sp. NPDC049599 TaxID=3363903 RepID=UPI0037B1CDEE
MARSNRFRRWLYPEGRANGLARAMNGISAVLFRHGILAPDNWVTLEVPGRRTGKTVACPLVIADYQGERYLVSMFGQQANWVANVRAAGGAAVLRHRSREDVRLVEVDEGERAPILRRYLELAQGARPHIPVDRRAPLPEFARVAARYPVFRVTAAG